MKKYNIQEHKHLIKGIYKLSNKIISAVDAKHTYNNENCICIECKNPIMGCDGPTITKTYFKHKVDNNNKCKYFQNIESAKHAEAKYRLKTILEEKKFSDIHKECISCTNLISCIDIFDNIKEYQVENEYSFPYKKTNKKADVAVIHKDGFICFEIYYTHKTKEKDRPEPWFEIDAFKFLESIENKKYETDKILYCIRKNEDCEICLTKYKEQQKYRTYFKLIDNYDKQFMNIYFKYDNKIKYYYIENNIEKLKCIGEMMDIIICKKCNTELCICDRDKCLYRYLIWKYLYFDIETDKHKDILNNFVLDDEKKLWCISKYNYTKIKHKIENIFDFVNCLDCKDKKCICLNIEKYTIKQKIDVYMICNNFHISSIEENIFKLNIDNWKILCKNATTIEQLMFLEKYKDKFSTEHWNILCENKNSYNILKNNIDKINWETLCKNITHEKLQLVDNNLNIIDSKYLNYLCIFNSNILYYMCKNNFYIKNNILVEYKNLLTKQCWNLLCLNTEYISFLKNNLNDINWYNLCKCIPKSEEHINFLNININKLTYECFEISDNSLYNFLCKNGNTYDHLKFIEKNIHKFDNKCLKLLCYNENTIHIIEENFDTLDLDKVCINILCEKSSCLNILEKISFQGNYWEILSTNKNSIVILENNLDKICWFKLCSNIHTQEQLIFLEKYLDKLDTKCWNSISNLSNKMLLYLCRHDNIFIVNILIKNLDKLNNECWTLLIHNKYFNEILVYIFNKKILNKFIDNIDWTTFINYTNNNDIIMTIIDNIKIICKSKYFITENIKNDFIISFMDVFSLEEKLTYICENFKSETDNKFILENIDILDNKHWKSLCENKYALPILKNNIDKIIWYNLCLKYETKEQELFIEENKDKLGSYEWKALSKNSNAISLLEKNKDKIVWISLYNLDKLTNTQYNFIEKNKKIGEMKKYKKKNKNNKCR